MKPQRRSNRIPGFTLAELLVVIVVLAALATLVVPTAIPHEKSTVAHCKNNLKQIAIANAMWAIDYNTNFPPVVSTNHEGTLEYLAGGRLDLHYQALAPYLPSPKILHCPADTREPATNYTVLIIANTSYFASLDAGISSFTLFLAGDRNLMLNDKMALPGLAVLKATNSLSWSQEMHRKTTKRGIGNIAFPDGHAESLEGGKSPSPSATLGTTTNRLIFP
jgi:prepilin-type N-terminal cleavage/methylation domain-containing protein/prepilin-type processing-associated H-X9-DG protein